MPRILLSYRRADSAAIVGRIYDRLVARYGAGAVFLDIDSIPYAQDFRDVVAEKLSESDVLLAVVGPQWLGRRDGPARIGDADDPVRVEIETALAKNVPIFPLLVDGARMPAKADMPPSLERFAFLNAESIDSGRDFHHHVDRLVTALDGMFGLAPPRAPPAAALARAMQHRYTWAVLLLAAGIAAGLAGLAPPWPPGSGPIAGAFGAVLLLGVDSLLGRQDAATANRTIVVAVVALFVTLGAYVVAAPIYVYEAPDHTRFAIGLRCTPEALIVYKAKCPNLGLDELRGAEYEADRLWTTQSISIVQALLDGAWLSAFAALGALGAGFQRRLRA